MAESLKNSNEMIENQIAIYPEGFRGKSRPDSTDMLKALAVQHLRWEAATAGRAAATGGPVGRRFAPGQPDHRERQAACAAIPAGHGRLTKASPYQNGSHKYRLRRIGRRFSLAYELPLLLARRAAAHGVRKG